MKKLLLIMLLSFSFASIALKPVEHFGICAFSSLLLYESTIDSDDYFKGQQGRVSNELVQHMNGGIVLGSFTNAFIKKEEHRDIFACSVIVGWEVFFYLLEGSNVDIYDISFGLLSYYAYKGLFSVDVSKYETKVFVPFYKCEF